MALKEKMKRNTISKRWLLFLILTVKKKGKQMLYCKIHHRLYVGDLQKWISFSDDDIKKLNATIIDGACNECVAVAKEELKKTFPVLYASLSNL